MADQQDLSKNKTKTIDDHLLEIEKSEYDFTKQIQLFEKCKQLRGAWDTKALIGLMIYKDEFLRNVKLGADTTDQNDFYLVNFVKDDLMLNINETLVPEIDTHLIDKRNAVDPIQDILNLEMNYVLDEQRIARDMKQLLIANKFMGFSCGKVYWDHDFTDEEWFTGMPAHQPIDSRKIWYILRQNRENKKDLIKIFHREQYTLDEFKELYPSYYEKYQEGVVATGEENLKHNYDYQMQIVNVIICQYVKKFVIPQRAVANEEPDSMTMKYFSEEEYEEYLREIGADDEMMDTFKQAGELEEDTPVFREKVRSSIKLKRTETRWFQTVFIPELNLELETPELVGKKSEYVLMPGEWNPDDIYPTPIAYDYRELLKVSGILLTTSVLNTVKLQKPIPIVVEGALKNEGNFLNNYWKLGVIAKVDAEWAKRNPGVKPVTWLAPPDSGQMQLMLYQMIEKLLDKSMSAPNVSRGTPDYAGQSGKSTELLQAQAKVSTKPDYFAVEEYLRQVGERFKTMIAEKRDYPHKIFLAKNDHIEGLTKIEGSQAIAEVNTNIDNQMADAAGKCYVRVEVEANVEAKNQIKDANYNMLYDRMDIPFDEYIVNQSWVKNPEQLIDAHQRSEGDRALVEMLQERPELKQQIIQMIQQNPDMEAEQPDNVRVE